MANKTIKRLRTQTNKQPTGRQSPAYHWLRAHHAAFAKMRAAGTLSWLQAAEELHRDNIKGGRGAALTDRNLARIWNRVCADVTRDAAIAASHPNPVLPIYPSRFPASVQPLEYSRPAATTPPSSPPKPAEPNVPASPTDRTPAQLRADAQLERMHRIVAERSGRKYPP